MGAIPAKVAIAKLLAKTRTIPVTLVFEDSAAVNKLVLRAYQPPSRDKG